MAATKEVDLDQFAKQLGAAAEKSVSYAVPLKQSAVAISAATKDNFAAGHGPNGEVWPPIKLERVRSGGAAAPLRDTGLLMASVTTQGAHHIEQVTPTTLRYGTNLDRAAVQQYGDVIRPKAGKKFLAIPRTIEAFRAGSPRNFPGLIPIFKGGNSGGEASSGVLATPPPKPGQKQKRRGKNQRKPDVTTQGRLVGWIIHYLLVRQVTIPPRPYLGIGPKLSMTIDRIFGDWLEKQAG